MPPVERRRKKQAVLTQGNPTSIMYLAEGLNRAVAQPITASSIGRMMLLAFVNGTGSN
jgi:hypothetical protein